LPPWTWTMPLFFPIFEPLGLPVPAPPDFCQR
jgi:hypothetical protein